MNTFPDTNQQNCPFRLKNIARLCPSPLLCCWNFYPRLHRIQNRLLPDLKWTPVHPELRYSPAHRLLWSHHTCPLELPLAHWFHLGSTGLCSFEANLLSPLFRTKRRNWCDSCHHPLELYPQTQLKSLTKTHLLRTAFNVWLMFDDEHFYICL